MAASSAHGFEVLVFSRTTGFRHASINDGIRAITQLGLDHSFMPVFTEDASAFTDEGLADYEAVVFLNTTGDVLNASQQAAMERFVQRGNGFVGIHAAADTEYGWAWYGGLIGAYFASHPPGTPTAEVHVTDAAHPSTAHLDRRWTRTDEWYNFQSNPRGDVHVLMTLDEDTYAGGTMGTDHPIAWCHDYDGGRSWYTAGGHTSAAFEEADFRRHLLFGIEWAAGAVEGDCGGTDWTGYEVTPLDTEVSNPMALDVAEDGRVFFVERGGRAKVYDPIVGRSTEILRLSVESDFEDGLLGVALDPDFETTNWIYLFYSPAGAVAKQHVSRFTYDGAALDPASEAVLLEIPTQRVECCHSGGDLEFAPDGSLYIATGDNTNPFADGYAPIDERADREPWDAQRSSGNTADLRGKVLRIVPQPDGSYTTPADNLFPDGIGGAPEIYAMGTRNPFRISVDPVNGWLYWGDVGPDASADSGERGPLGLDEWNQARTSGHFGWPYCIGPNRAYRDYDYATGAPGALFDCAATTNDSPNNTGASVLPPAQPAWVYYPYGPSPEFPDVINGDGRTAIAGPVYQYDPARGAGTQLPQSYDGAFFIAEWARNWLAVVTLDDDGQPLDIVPFLPDVEVRRPIAFEQGPDGALYLIEWGTGFGGDNPDAQLVRIAYVAGSRAPTARLDAAPTAGAAPLTVQFSAAASSDPDPDETLSYAWDFDTDGVTDATAIEAAFTYEAEGSYVAALTVTDSEGNQGRASVTITVGNTPPAVTILQPVEGGFYDWSDRVPFEIAASDAEDGSTEDGSISCRDVFVQAFIGHDDHSHPLVVRNGCEGTIQIADGHGDDGEELFYLVEATYTDSGSGPAGALTGRTLHQLQPRSKEAEHFTLNSGTQLEDANDPLGGDSHLAFIDHGDYVVYDPVNLANITHVTYRYASAGTGGRIEVRADAPDGELLGTAYLDPTGDWQSFRSVTAPIRDPGGTRPMVLLFLNDPGDEGLFNLNKLRFHGQGVAEERPPSEAPGWNASFTALDGSSSGTREVEPALNYNWRTDPPIAELQTNAFSGRWAADLTVPAGGRYLLSALVDGAVTVTMQPDGAGQPAEVLIDQAETAEPLTTDRTLIQLGADETVRLMVDYVNTSGPAQLTLLINSIDVPEQPIPAEWLRPATLVVGDDAAETAPLTFELAEPYPNPMTETVTLSFTLTEAAPVRLELMDALGRTVRTLVDERRARGRHTVRMDGQGLASGLYVCRLVAGSNQATQRLVVVR